MKNGKTILMIRWAASLALLGAVPSAATAEWTGAATGPEWWQYECNQDWDRSQASRECTGTVVQHIGVRDQYNTCEVATICPGQSYGAAIRGGAEKSTFHLRARYRGRNVDLRALHNCNGKLKVGSC